MEWSSDEVTALKQLAKKYPSRVYENKDERWRLVSKKMPGRSKRNCYMMYKQIRRSGVATQTQARRFSSTSNADSCPQPMPVSRKNRVSSLNSTRVNPFRSDGVEALRKSQQVENMPTTAVPDRHRCSHDLAVTDLEDEETIVENWQQEESKSYRITNSLVLCKPSSVSLGEAKALRKILFGTRKPNCFADSWRRQGICFSDFQGLTYGLVQHTGGPCGVIAVVQACFLKHLLFTSQRKTPTRWCDIAGSDRDAILVIALSEMIWRCRASDAAQAAVVVSGQPRRLSEWRGSRDYRPGGISENMDVYRTSAFEDLQTIIAYYLRLFTDKKGSGVVMLLYSCLLSRGVLDSRNSVRDDFDTGLGGNLCLIGKCNYASQEMVNLLITGRAVSNVFDGEKFLPSDASSGDGDGNDLKLRGLEKQSEIGFLTLFEHYECMLVGDRFKCPKYPIWVVCSESHYSVLFSIEEEFEDEGVFDLYYYDELGMQEESIRLTIDPYPEYVEESKYHGEDPPLECCIRTKWPAASIDWNESDVIY